MRVCTEKLVDELPDNYLEEILLDSGATHHMIKSKSQLTHLVYNEEPTGELNALNWVRTAAGHVVPVKGHGTFRNIKGVLWVPDLEAKAVLSIGLLIKSDYEVTITNPMVQICNE